LIKEEKKEACRGIRTGMGRTKDLSMQADASLRKEKERSEGKPQGEGTMVLRQENVAGSLTGQGKKGKSQEKRKGSKEGKRELITNRKKARCRARRM